MEKQLVTLVNKSGRRLVKLPWQKLFKKTALVLRKNLQPVTFVFVTPSVIQKLNKTYRGQAKPTNILSFGELREIILTPVVIAKEAKVYGIKSQHWTAQLVIHGLLHLEGMDHRTPEATQKMEDVEERIMKELGDNF